MVVSVLDLAYDPAVPAPLLREMERAARGMGLSLAAIERLGQDEGRCAAFVRAARLGDTARLRALARRADEATAVPAPRPAPRAVATLR